MVLQWLKPKTQPLSQATTDDKILFNVLCLSLYRVIHKSVNYLIDCSMKWELYYNLLSKRSTDSIWTFAIFVSPWTSFEPLMSQTNYLYRFTALIFFKFENNTVHSQQKCVFVYSHAHSCTRKEKLKLLSPILLTSSASDFVVHTVSPSLSSLQNIKLQFSCWLL